MIVGSTQKMGVGTNIQARAIALHHVDVPWRPADVAQRDGRIMRQGNQNPTVGIYRYVTEGSFDTYMWQTVERKARFINQVMRGRLDVREIEDLGEDVIGFAELKAIASGDPLILEKAKIDAEAERLSRVERAWQRGHHALRSTIAAGEERAGVRERQIAAVNHALPRVRDTRGELFSMTIDGRTYTHRTDAAGALASTYGPSLASPRDMSRSSAGLQVDAELLGDQAGEQYLHLTLHGLPAQPATLKRSQLANAGLSLIRQLEHRVQTLPDLAARLESERVEALREAAAARDQLARPFKYAEPARPRAPPPRAHRRADRRTATTTTRTPSAKPPSPASTPTPPPRSRSRTAPILSQPRRQPNPPPGPPPPPPLRAAGRA